MSSPKKESGRKGPSRARTSEPKPAMKASRLDVARQAIANALVGNTLKAEAIDGETHLAHGDETHVLGRGGKREEQDTIRRILRTIHIAETGAEPGRESLQVMRDFLSQHLQGVREEADRQREEALEDARSARSAAQDTETVGDAGTPVPVEFVREDDEVTPPLVARYSANEMGIVYHAPGKDGGFIPILVANFTARILEQVDRDDGVERIVHFLVEAELAQQKIQGLISASQFSTVDRWAVELLGARATVSAGFSMKDRAREAIQRLSTSIDRRTVYLHTGWRKIGEYRFYLHGDGAIGPKCPECPDCPGPEVEVELPALLEHFRLCVPEDQDTLKRALGASLDLLDLADVRVMVVVLGFVWRSVLPGKGTDLSGHLVGPTGAGKSEIATLAMQHFGKGFERKGLPSWSSTGNSLETLAFVAKDALVVLDDFAPGGTAFDIQRQHKEADRVLRAQGNRSGRMRCRPDGSLRPTKPPRATPLSTGEDVPRGASLRARLVIIEVPASGQDGAVDWDRMTKAQVAGAEGLFAMVMGAFVGFLAGKYDSVASESEDLFRQFREQARGFGRHARDPEKTAHLALGWNYLLDFALEQGLIDEEEQHAIWDRVWTALSDAAGLQAQHQVDSDPVERFLTLLRSAISSGAAHIATPEGGDPTGGKGGLGWFARHGAPGMEQAVCQGSRIGWVTDDQLLLDLDAALKAANTAAGATGESIPLNSRTVAKRLDEAGLLVETETGRLSVKRTVEGQRLRVHSMSRTVLDEGDEPIAPPPHSGPGQSGHSGHTVADDLESPNGKGSNRPTVEPDRGSPGPLVGAGAVLAPNPGPQNGHAPGIEGRDGVESAPASVPGESRSIFSPLLHRPPSPDRLTTAPASAEAQPNSEDGQVSTIGEES